MVKRKRLPSASSKPATGTTTTTTGTQGNLRRNGRQSSQISTDSTRLDVKRSRSTDSADSTAAPQVRGRSAPTSSARNGGNSESTKHSDIYTTTIPNMDPQ